MSRVAFLFPGQGAQYVGMGRELAEQYPLVARYFEQASDLLGFDVGKLCWEEPEAVLKETANQQPAILICSVACLALLTEAGIRPDVVAGLSLGEYSALVAAEALSFEEAVPLVRKRGAYMQEAVPAGSGGMAAVLGFDAERVDQLCAEAREMMNGLVVESANYNCPGQIVISGHHGAVEQVIALAVKAGGKAVKLSVTAPFHSSLLSRAGEMLSHALAAVTLKPPVIPVVSNVTADYVLEPDHVRELLVKQVSSPVRWEESMRRLIADGVETFIEVGPSKTLTGFMKRINKNFPVLNVEDAQSLGKVLASCGRVC